MPINDISDIEKSDKVGYKFRMDQSTFTPPSSSLRRTLFVNRPVQFYIFSRIFLLVLLATFLILGDYYFFFGRHMASNLMDPNLFYLFLKNNSSLVAELVVFGVVTLAAALMVSHRIAGPLYRLQRSFRFLEKGDLSHHARIRKDDQMHELVKDYNATVLEVSKRVSNDRKRAEDLAKQLEKLAATANSPELKTNLKMLSESARQITKEFNL
jgi:methyl-accepting chemotaxis protein